VEYGKDDDHDQMIWQVVIDQYSCWLLFYGDQFNHQIRLSREPGAWGEGVADDIETGQHAHNKA